MIKVCHEDDLVCFRDRRKSASTKHFYPIEDEGEDDIFVPATSDELKSSPKVKRDYFRCLILEMNSDIEF